MSWNIVFNNKQTVELTSGLVFSDFIVIQACQLVRAVATLLELSNEEEKYVRDYLQYKVSLKS